MGTDSEPTHEIRDGQGAWIWKGSEQSMHMLFANLSGQNFECKPVQAYDEYMAWIREFIRELRAGSDDPLRDGQMIELAPIGGRAIDSVRLSPRAPQAAFWEGACSSSSDAASSTGAGDVTHD